MRSTDSQQHGKRCWIMLRGLVRESGHWGPFLGALQKKFPQDTVITLDLPGNGEFVEMDSPLSIGDNALFLQEQFEKKASTLKQEGYQFYLFANSLGAMVALEWQHQFPDQFNGVVCLNTSLRQSGAFYERLSFKIYPEILKAFGTLDIKSREKRILSLVANSLPGREVYGPLWEQIQEKRPVKKVNAIRQLMAAARFGENLPAPHIPVLLLVGHGDRLVNPKCSLTLGKQWKCSVQIHPYAGHDLAIDAPEWALDETQRWIIDQNQ